jgi:hypothetical protein
MTARTMVLVAGLLAGWASPSLANDDLAQRGNFLGRLGFPYWPAVRPSSTLAPWYMWWPAEAAQIQAQHDFQSSPYPTWPATPPQATAMPQPAGQITFVPPPQYPGNPYAGNPYQAVSYPRTVPSYWYGR